jgi:TonB family protein
MVKLKFDLLPEKDFLPPASGRSKFSFDAIEPIEDQTPTPSFRANLKVIEGGKGLPKLLKAKDIGFTKPLIASFLVHGAFLCLAWWIGHALIHMNSAPKASDTNNQIFMVSIVGSKDENFPAEDNSEQKEPQELINKNLILEEKQFETGKSVVQAKPVKKEKKKQNSKPDTIPEEATKKTSSQEAQSSTGQAGSSLSPVGGTGGTAEVTYQQLVAAHIAKNKRYPKRARERGIEGQVLISISLFSNGAIEKLSILNSDSSLLSEGVESMIQNAAPFPAFLESMKSSSVSFQVPIRFNLMLQ